VSSSLIAHDISAAHRAMQSIRAGSAATRARKPDFFILGAPKCGTTSLAAWLAEHPRIFLSPVKEPHFFNTDDRQGVTTLAEYEALFDGATPRHGAVGEASVWYLSSADAVRNILRYQPDARFIVMLRNPVEMAPALHAEMLLSGHENVRDFTAAWQLQAERREGRHLPAFSWAMRRLQYGEACALGAQLQRLLQTAPADRVLSIVLDDVIEDPRREYLRVLRFLGVDDDGRVAFPAYNKAKVPRWPGLARAMFVVLQMRRRIGIRRGLNLWQRVFEVNRIETPRAPLPPGTLAQLRQHFTGDVKLLGRLLGRDLQHWLAPTPD
jgi:hypothetical protein